jgi:hypothetical protein
MYDKIKPWIETLRKRCQNKPKFDMPSDSPPNKQYMKFQLIIRFFFLGFSMIYVFVADFKRALNNI